MDERDAFLAAIRADPGDDAPRLAFADWLDERGEVRRARFIRAQVHGAAHHGRGVTWPVRGRGARTGFADLVSRKPWARDHLLGTGDEPTGYIQVTTRRSAVLWRRGFIEGLLCSGFLLPRALEALGQHPVREILLTSEPSRTVVRSIDPGAGVLFRWNPASDDKLVRLLRRRFPSLVRAKFTERRPTRRECFFRVVG